MRGYLAFVCSSLIAVAACGGSSDSPPGPLAKHFDEMYIAAIPLDQKKDVVQTQQDWNIARMENANAEAQVKESDSQLHQARNDQKATRLAIDSAVSAKKSADASVDIQFGGCDGKVPNCLPIMQEWTYMVRLYRPRDEIINRTWKFPEAQRMN